VSAQFLFVQLIKKNLQTNTDEVDLLIYQNASSFEKNYS